MSDGLARIVAPSITDLFASTASNPGDPARHVGLRVRSWITMPGSARSSGPGSRSPLLTVPKSRNTARTLGRFSEQCVDEGGQLAGLFFVIAAGRGPAKPVWIARTIPLRSMTKSVG